MPKLKFTNKLIALGLLFFVFVIYVHNGIRQRVDEAKALYEAQKTEEFNKIIQFIDTNTKNLKIYIPDIRNPINDKYLENQMNHGHGEFITKFKEHSMIILNTHQFALDYVFYDRIRQDRSLVVQDLNRANVIYIPIMSGSLCHYFYNYSIDPIPIYMDIMHDVAAWFEENEENLKDKAILMVHSRGENTLTNL
jgi:hypothetical protein